MPITHLHIDNFSVDSRIVPIERWKIPDDEQYIKIMSILWVKRFRALLDADLPFKKVGIAHLQWFNFHSDMTSAKTLDLISDVDLNDLFSRAAEKGRRHRTEL